MMISVTLIATLIWLCFIHPSISTTIDSFSEKGNKNKLKYRRLYTSECKFEIDGLRIPPGGSVTEYLASRNTGSMNMTGKSLQLIYSIERREICQIIVRNQGQHGRSSKNNQLTVILPLGREKIFNIPLADFRSVRTWQILSVKVQGPMLLHKIKIVRKVNAIASSTEEIALSTSHPRKVLPMRLIDDFKHCLGPLVNSLNAGRIVTDGAKIELPGFVLIAREYDFILEQFASQSAPLNMQYMAFRFVYSSTYTRKQSLGLVHKPELDTGNGEKNLLMTEYEFPAAQSQKLDVPTSSFMQSDPKTKNVLGYGLMVYGPMILHRIELVMNEQERLKILSSSYGHADYRDIDNFMKKYRYLRNAVQLLTIPQTYHIVINGANDFMDSMNQMTVESFRMDLDVSYLFTPQAKKKSARLELFFKNIHYAISSVELGLFDGPSKRKYLRIVPNTNVHPGILDQYRFVGRLIGMAIINRKKLMTNVSDMVYNILLDLPPSHFDLFDFHLTMYKGTQTMFNVNSKFQYMTAQYTDDITNELVTVNLVPNGQNILVQDHNRKEYIKAYYMWYMNRHIGAQANALREGFYDIIPKTLVEGFSAKDLRYICAAGEFKHHYLPTLTF